MKKIFILTVAIVLSLFMLISRNEHIGINLSLNSDVLFLWKPNKPVI